MQSLQVLKSLACVDRQLLEDRILRFYELRATYNVPEMTKLLSERVIYTTPGDRSVITYTGRHTGRAAVMVVLQTMNIEYQQLSQDIGEVCVDGNCVVVHRTCSLRHRGTGIVRRVEICDIVRFEDGLISEIRSFGATRAMPQMAATWRGRATPSELRYQPT